MSETSSNKLPTLTPVPGKVYLRRLEPPAAPSPYLTPDTAKEKSVEAVVLAIPALPYVEYGMIVSCPVNVGDRVLVGKYAGDYKFRGEDITVVRWDEILAVIPEVLDEADAARIEELQTQNRFVNKLAKELLK